MLNIEKIQILPMTTNDLEEIKTILKNAGVKIIEITAI